MIKTVIILVLEVTTRFIMKIYFLPIKLAMFPFSQERLLKKILSFLKRFFHLFIEIFVCLKVPNRSVLRLLKKPFFGEFRSLITPIWLIYFRSLKSPKRLAFRHQIYPE